MTAVARRQLINKQRYRQPSIARPVFRSQSYEYAAGKIAQLLAGQLQFLFLSGPKGVGKTLLLDKEVSSSDAVAVCRLQAGADDSQHVLARLLLDVGPGPVSGTTQELRNILHVFLRHQAARGRRALVVVDGVERDALDVVREIELRTSTCCFSMGPI